MAKHNHNAKSPKTKTAVQWRTAWGSERLFAKHWLHAVNAGLIKKFTDKQTRNAAHFVKSGGFVTKMTVVSNKNGSTSKAAGVISTGLPHSPLKEAGDAALRARKNQFLAAVIQYLCSLRGVDRPYVYMVTYTKRNSNKGELDAGLTWLLANLKDIRDAIQHAKTRKSGLHLPADGGGDAALLGDLVSIEITLRDEALKRHLDFELFHEHAHQIMISDKPLDMSLVKVTRKDVPNMVESVVFMPAAAKVLFQRWAAYDPTAPLSGQAFGFEAAYDGKNPEKAQSGFASALAEANKYAIKPDFFKNLPDDPSTFSTEAFAEAYNAVSGHKMHRSHGVFQDASGFVNWVNTSKLGSAVMNASFLGQSRDAGYVPDLFTAVHDLDTAKKRVSLSGSQKLQGEQLLWANRSILSGAGFDGDLMNHVQWPHSKKAQLYKQLCAALSFTPKGKAGLLFRLDGWAALVRGELDQLEDGASSYKSYLWNKLEDLQAVRKAAADLLNTDGAYAFQVDWSRRAKVLSALDTAAEMQRQGVVDWETLDEHRHEPAKGEAQLLSLYGGELLAGGNAASKFIDPEFCAAIVRYLHNDRAEIRAALWSWNSSDFLAERAKNRSAAVLVYDGTGCEGLLNDAYEVTAKNYTDCKIETTGQLQKLVAGLA